MQVRGIAHLQHDIGRQGAHAAEQALGQDGLVARDHHDGHGLADGAADAEDDAREDAGARGGEHGGEDAALMRCTQRKRALIIALRHGAQRRFRDADDGRQDHDAEHDGSRDDALAAAEHGLQGRDKHDKAEEAIDDGRDAGQQIDGGLQHAVEALRAEARQKQRAQQAQRDADEDRAARDEDAGDDHGEDAVEVLVRRPGHAEQEFAEADLMHGGDAVGKQENADERHGKDGDAGRQQEDDLHGPFPNGVEIVFHSSS